MPRRSSLPDPAHIKEVIGSGIGSLGPIGLQLPIYVDHSAALVSDFSCGANQDDKHYINANWGRDCDEPQTVDIRNVVSGDPSPDGKGKLGILRGIEVGHIFQLGTKYSEAMQATVLDQNGKAQPASMGCYGIGITRVVAAAIEQNHDDRGIYWPDSLAPFQLAICPMNYSKSEQVKTLSDRLYQQCLDLGIDVLLDDRGLRPGAMFADLELIGVPHRIVIGDRGLKNEMFEYKGRRDDESVDLPLSNLESFLKEKFV